MKNRYTPQILDALIEQDACFAIFRLPDETSLRFVMQTSGMPSLFRDIDDLAGQQGFVIAPFRITADSPVIMIRPDCTELPDKEIHPNHTGLSEITEFPNHNSPPEACAAHRSDTGLGAKVYDNINTGSHRTKEESAQIRKRFPEPSTDEKEEYSRLFKRFLEPLANGEMEKIVLSRKKTIDREETFSSGRSFFNAAEKYPHSYVYLFNTPQSGTWLGSTPEILLEGAKNRWHTIALAGTRYPNSNPDGVTWDEKNLREQHLVTSYLLNRLSSFHIVPEIKGPYTIKAGALAHLRTDFSFRLPHGIKPETLLKALHPTPAVSGLPKTKAYRFIKDNEKYNRRYYSGFLGIFNTKGESNIYVNIRCMHIEKKSLTLYTGGGLLASSLLEDEWEETEHKLSTMLNII